MFILEGNIGAGKTTLLTQIKLHAQKELLQPIEVVFEPVNSWHKQDAGQSLLSNFYTDIPRWAYTLETYAMACRVREHIAEQQQSNPFRLIERSIYSGHYCFAYNSYHGGGMSSIEWAMYSQWYNFLLRNKCKAPMGFIYLKSTPEVCLERIHKRNRTGECNITLDYLKRIDERHNEFLLNKNGVTTDLKQVPVLTLDGNQPFATDEELFKNYHICINSFMQNIAATHRPPMQQSTSLYL